MEQVKAKRGRKPVSDKKKMVAIYLRQSEIANLGGLTEIRNKIYETLKTKSHEA